MRLLKIGRKLTEAVDFAIGIVNPERAMMRRHFRRMDEDDDYRESIFAVMRQYGYRAASNAKGLTGWTGSGGSADLEILSDLPKLRNRTRELNRDDPIASGLTRTLVQNIIGTGMRPQARTDDPEKNKRIEAVYKERVNSLSPEGICAGAQQRMKCAKVIEDGEVFVKAAKAKPTDPIFFETVEAERVEKINKDEFGRVKSYTVRKAHPNDVVNDPSQIRKTMEFEEVSVEAMRHARIVTRPGQSRGVPMFHAILQDLRDLDLLLLASLKRCQIAACIAAFIESTASTPSLMQTTATKYGYRMEQEIVPGMMFKLYPGEKLSTLVPNFPVPELAPFIIMLARRIGAALGLSWQIVLKDFSQANYSSARTDLLESRQTYVILQDWFQQELFNWEWRQVLEDAILRGDERLKGVTAEDIATVRWIANGWRWIDPENEAKSTEIELRIGTTTLRDTCAGQGDDWEEIQDQRLLEEAREMKRRKELGLPDKNAVPQAPANDPAADKKPEIKPAQKPPRKVAA